MTDSPTQKASNFSLPQPEGSGDYSLGLYISYPTIINTGIAHFLGTKLFLYTVRQQQYTNSMAFNHFAVIESFKN